MYDHQEKMITNVRFRPPEFPVDYTWRLRYKWEFDVVLLACVWFMGFAAGTHPSVGINICDTTNENAWYRFA